ncbi:MAG: hypothetical protein U0521_13205 [Anaerolineae bacterium]
MSDIFVLSSDHKQHPQRDKPSRALFDTGVVKDETAVLSYDPGASDPTDIFVLDLSNDSISNLTHQSGYNTNPVWISNGQQIAFTSYGVSPKKSI